MKKLNLLIVILLMLLTLNMVYAQEDPYIMTYEVNRLYKYDINFNFTESSGVLSTSTNTHAISGNNNTYTYIHKDKTKILKVRNSDFAEIGETSTYSSVNYAKLTLDNEENFIYWNCETNKICRTNTENFTTTQSADVGFVIGTLFYYEDKLFMSDSGTTTDKIFVYNATNLIYIGETANQKWTGTTNSVIKILGVELGEIYYSVTLTDTRIRVLNPDTLNIIRTSGNLPRISGFDSERDNFNINLGETTFYYTSRITSSPFTTRLNEVFKSNLTINEYYEYPVGYTGSPHKIHFINDDLLFMSYYGGSSTKYLYNINTSDLSGGIINQKNLVAGLVQLMFSNTATEDETIIYDSLTCLRNNFNELECFSDTGVCFPYDGETYICEDFTLVNTGYGIELFCDIDSLNFCSGGCEDSLETNPYGIEYLLSTCLTSDLCTNECNIEGLTYSDTSTSYRRCGFYDADVCLEWSSSIPCETGQYSQDGFCIDLDTTSETYFAKTSFSMLPEIIRASTYDLSGNNPFVRLQSSSSFVTIGFNYQSALTDFYILQNCNYNEITIVNDIEEYETTEKETIFSGYTNGITEVKFDLPNNDTEVFIIGIDNNEDQIYNYKVQRNITYGVCVFDELYNSSLVGCQTEPSTNLKDVTFKVQTITIGNNYAKSIMMRLNGVTGFRDLYTSFFITDSENIYYKNVINSTENITISLVNIKNGEEYIYTWKNSPFLIYVNDKETAMDRTISLDVFKTLYNSIPTAQVTEYFNEHYQYYVNKNQNMAVYNNICHYTDIGEFKVRSYYARNLNEFGLWNYKEYDVFVDRLGSRVTATSVEGGAFNNMSKQTKLFISLIFLMVIIAGLLVLGFYLDQIKIFSFLATFMAVGFAIFFSIIGFLPVWILILMFIISGLGVMVLMRNIVTGSGSD